MPEEQRAELDRLLRDEDDRIERQTGFRPQRGPDKQIIKDNGNNFQFSFSDVFEAVGKKFNFGAHGKKSAPPTTGRYNPQPRFLKPGF